ncbi:MAG: LAGLIDADG family homing endonuclease, partial [Nanoarchaeota archaeon]|nr:LAGLIDADG family homing endonuclease [Nanoarchaeota archaeon]
KSYYTDHISPLMKSIFGFSFNSKFRSGGAHGVWGIQTSKKEVSTLFLSYGFTPGRKTHTVTIPSFIFESSLEVKRALVRGLFDTDGCIRFDRINKQALHTYPRIEYSSASEALIDSLNKLLYELGFKSYSWKYGNYFALCISGKLQLEKWIAEIKPGNPKHLKKYLFWREKGFYAPSQN